MNAIDGAWQEFQSLTLAGDSPTCRAGIKRQFEDFQVDEVIGFNLSGVGEHLYLRVRKCNRSTTEVARHIARRLALRRMDIGYSGMKDRRAVSTQWFSLPAGQVTDIDPKSLNDDGIEVIETGLNDRKLRLGSHRANAFRVRLSDFEGEMSELRERLDRAAKEGVPNYFGPQRFGKDLSNLRQAQDYFESFDDSGRAPRVERVKKGILLSATRSYLFNQILSRRVTQRSWNRILDGEVFNLEGTKRLFKAAEGEAGAAAEAAGQQRNESHLHLQQRIDDLDIHPTGLLAGQDRAGDPYRATAQVKALESEIVGQYPLFEMGLARQGVEASRRALRLVPRQCSLEIEQDSTPVLNFVLGAGGYATALLRELLIVESL